MRYGHLANGPFWYILQSDDGTEWHAVGAQTTVTALNHEAALQALRDDLETTGRPE
jgi:hypothetical protein